MPHAAARLSPNRHAAHCRVRANQSRAASLVVNPPIEGGQAWQPLMVQGRQVGDTMFATIAFGLIAFCLALGILAEGLRSLSKDRRAS
jgi:hypothetical protein